MKSLYQRRRSLGATLLRSDMDEETKAAGAKLRKNSGAAPAPAKRRSSLAQILFGANSPQNTLQNQNFGTLKNTSQGSLTLDRNSGTARRRSRPSITVPLDSREKHRFHSSSGSEDEAFVDDDVFNQEALSESIEAFLASRKTTDKSVKTSSQEKTKLVMKKTMKVVVAGGKKTGKTALLQQLACFNDITTQQYSPTIEDTYQIQTQIVDSQDPRPKEVVIFYDTGGISDYGNPELKKPYLQVADAFVLVYSVVDHESFNRMDVLKKTLEKQFNKEKKEIPIVVVGTMTDLPGRTVDSEFANSWANKEKVRLFEVTSKNRSALVEIVHYLVGRHFHPIKESKFSLSKKLRPEKSSASSQQILTDNYST
ncbi:hypothetical protein FO519_004642 [Halicephalobus sp. NKZ332]|nr:hypothetical protein FO519_004642 [Halicephalobus sp. NKZ332]